MGGYIDVYYFSHSAFSEVGKYPVIDLGEGFVGRGLGGIFLEGGYGSFHFGEGIDSAISCEMAGVDFNDFMP
jgi:hypothetical protein